MGKCVANVFKIVLAILPVVCIIVLTVTIVVLAVSLNPDVKWNEYREEVYANTGIYAYYFNTISSSLDASSYDSSTSGNYLQILDLKKVNNTLIHDESWKEPIRKDIYMAIGLVSGTMFLFNVALVVNAVTKEKFFTVLTKVFAIGTGIAGGCLILKATNAYKDGIPAAILESARLPVDQNGYYHPDKEQMKMGYNLALTSAVSTFVGCALILVNVGVYIPFADGYWIWKKNTEVKPLHMETPTP